MRSIHLLLLTGCSPCFPARKNLTTDVAHPPHGADCMVRGQVDVAFSREFRLFPIDFPERIPEFAPKSTSAPQCGHSTAMFWVARRKLFDTKFATHSDPGDLNFGGGL
jgi:hypothetical protein